jgi:hypothetical protein
MSVADVLGPGTGYYTIDVAGVNVDGAPFSPSPNSVGVVASASGVWAGPQTFNYTYTYIGTPGVTPCMVTITLTNLTATGTTPGFVTITPNLPLNLTPANNPNYAIMVVDNAQDAAGYVSVNTIDGQMFIETVLNSGSFTGTGATGWNGFSFSYTV